MNRKIANITISDNYPILTKTDQGHLRDLRNPLSIALKPYQSRQATGCFRPFCPFPLLFAITVEKQPRLLTGAN